MILSFCCFPNASFVVAILLGCVVPELSPGMYQKAQLWAGKNRFFGSLVVPRMLLVNAIEVDELLRNIRDA